MIINNSTYLHATIIIVIAVIIIILLIIRRRIIVTNNNHKNSSHNSDDHGNLFWTDILGPRADPTNPEVSAKMCGSRKRPHPGDGSHHALAEV